MSLTWKRALPVSLVVAILVSAAASLAFAGDGGSAPNGSFLARKGWAGRESGVILGYIAGKANVNVKTLMEELKTGKSLQDIAAEHGLDLEAIKAELTAKVTAARNLAGKDVRGILCYIAGKANVDVKTLMEELKGGKSLQDIAAEHGLDLAAIEARIASDRSNGGKQFFAPGGFGRRTPARRGGKGM
jgi:uncharacterized protein (DUF433 family)